MSDCDGFDFIREAIGSVPAAELSRAHVADLLGSFEGDRSPLLAALRKLFSFADSRGWSWAPTRPQEQHLQHDEVVALFDAIERCACVGTHRACWTMLCTGLDQSEIVAMREADLHEASITVRHGRKRREVPVTHDVARILPEYASGISGNGVFWSKPPRSRTINDALHVASILAEIPAVSAGHLRRTFVFQALAHGVPVGMIAAGLNLSKAKTIRRYRQQVVAYLDVVGSRMPDLSQDAPLA